LTGGGVGGGISTRKNLTSHTLIVAVCLILLGCGLMFTISDTPTLDQAVYGYQCILGLGTGLTFSSVTMMTNLANEPENIGELQPFARPIPPRILTPTTLLAAAQGAISQARIFGGSIGLSIATIILNHKLTTQLTGIVSPSQLRNLEQSLTTILKLGSADRAAVAVVYAASFNAQMRICTYLSAVAIVAAMGTFLKAPPSIAATKEREREKEVVLVRESESDGRGSVT
jgi:hypothetical protein